MDPGVRGAFWLILYKQLHHVVYDFPQTEEVFWQTSSVSRSYFVVSVPSVAQLSVSVPFCNRIFTAIMPMVAAGLIADDPTLQPIRRLVSLVRPFFIVDLCVLFLTPYRTPACNSFYLFLFGTACPSLLTSHWRWS